MNIAKTIESELLKQWPQAVLVVENESSNHSVPRGSQTHFKVTMVSSSLKGLSLVKRHQLVFSVLKPLMACGVHALSLHLYTPAEWKEKGEKSPESPDCRGGSH